MKTYLHFVSGDRVPTMSTWIDVCRQGPIMALFLALSLAGSSSCRAPAATKVTLFAAASTADAITEAARLFESQTGIAVRLSFAASSVLARQIEAGAEVDLFLAANPAWMDYLATRALLWERSRRDLLANRLAVIHNPGIGAEKGYAWLESWPHGWAVGDPAHVPVGNYARQALQSLGWWEGLAQGMVPCADARDALHLVERGEVDVGIVYLTDALSSPRVVLAGILPRHAHSPIRYPLVLGPNPTPDAHRFYQFLFSPTAWDVFAKHGFEKPEEKKKIKPTVRDPP